MKKIFLLVCFFFLSFGVVNADQFYINNTGGDCSKIGVWDASSQTCKLSAPLAGAVYIEGNGITLDGSDTYQATTSNQLVNFLSSIYINGYKNNTIKNLTVSRGDGISLRWATSTTLDNITSVYNSNGFRIENSENVTIENSTVKDPSGYGLYIVSDVRNLTLHNNHFSQSILADDGSGYRKNIFLLSPLTDDDQSRNIVIDSDNTIDGRVIYYFENQNGTVFDNLPNAGVFYCVNCQNITLASTTFDGLHNETQINLYKTTTSNIENNTVKYGSLYGAFLYKSDGNKITGNYFYGHQVGIGSASSSGNIYENNKFEDSPYPGIELSLGGLANLITRNIFTDTNGVSLLSGATADIVQNNFFSSRINRGSDRDISIYGTSNVISIAHDLPVGGNYYSNYDLNRGGCVDQDNDGVCDSPYDIPGLNEATETFDAHPWATPNGWLNYKNVPLDDNVLFLPGIEASRLYTSDASGTNENRLWEPDGNSDVQNLYMDANGKSIGTNIYTRDLLDEAYAPAGPNIYASFLATLEKMKSTDHSIADYSAVPYDWRLSIDDILNGGTATVVNGKTQISYLNATTSPYIISELRRLVASSRSGKVTIVAHSNGGLVAKALLKRLADTGDPLLLKIDKLVLVAVPQLGTPAAIAADLHGTDQGLPTDSAPFLLSKSVARGFAQNSAIGYNLLPDQNYFTNVDTPVVTFDSTLPDWSAKYGSVIHSTDRLQNFLLGTYGRVSATSANTQAPDTLNPSLFSQSESLHDALDSWTPPAGLHVVEIAGWGIPTTISGINYTSENGAIAPHPAWTVDGDGTVASPSALWENSPSEDRYWLDVGAYNKDNFLTHIPLLGSLFALNHKNILEVSSLNNFISDIITDSIKPVSNYAYLSAVAPASTGNRLQYTLNSPASLNMYDSAGHHTGVSTTTGKVEEQIPGTYYEEFGNSKYIFTDTSAPVKISMSSSATGTSTLSFAVSELSGDTQVASTTFKNIPTTPATQVTLTVQSGASTVSSMNIDFNGDGKVDATLPPKLDGTVTLDMTAPTTTATVSGTKGKNGWYTSSVSVKLNATDADSGVATTTYSLTGGAKWLTYSTSTPISLTTEGTTTLLYYSTDNAGNREATSTMIIKIDKTAPEAVFSFDPTTKKINIVGSDNLSSTTVTTTNPKNIFQSATSVIEDASGHTLTVTYAQPILFNLGRNIIVMIKKLTYDTGLTSKVFPLSILSYDWSLDKKDNFMGFDQKLFADKNIMFGSYDPKKNTTTLTTLMYNGKDTDGDRQMFDRDDHQDKKKTTKQTLQGMVVLKLQTNKGVLNVGY